MSKVIPIYVFLILLVNVKLLAQNVKLNLDIGVGVSYLHSDLQTVNTFNEVKQEFTQINSNLLAKYRIGISLNWYENEFITISNSLGVLSSGFRLKYRDVDMINRDIVYRRHEAYTGLILELSPFRTQVKTKKGTKKSTNTDIVILIGCEIHYFLFGKYSENYLNFMETNKLYFVYNFGLGFKTKHGKIQYRINSPIGSNFEDGSIFENSHKLLSHTLIYFLPLKK